MELREANHSKLENLEQEKKFLVDQIKNLRLQLVGHEPEIITDIDQEIGKLRVKLQGVISKNEFLSNLFVDVQTGISHFNERLEVLQIDSDETFVDDNNVVEAIKRLGQKAKTVYQVIERNRHFNELCRSKAPLVNENVLINGFSQNMNREIR